MKISVIIPVFKAEKYLKRCLDSLVGQSFDNYEVIIVDDGSTDKSSAICDEYAEKYDYFFVYHKKNEGVSKARQDGLYLAKGDFVIYTDPDDWVEPDYLSSLYNKAISENSDMVICDFYAEYENNSLYLAQEPTHLDNITVRDEFFPFHNGCTWNKLIRRKLIINNNVAFPLGVRFCEDLYFNCSLLLNDIRISYVKKALYHYDQIVNSNSLVRYYDDSTYEHDIALLDKFIELFKNDTEPKRMRAVLIRNFAERAFWGNIYTSTEYKRLFYKYRILLKNEASDLDGILYYLSSVGFYKIAYFIIVICKKLKLKLRKYYSGVKSWVTK